MKIVDADTADCAEILDLQKAAYLQEAEIYGDYSIPPLTQTVEELRADFDSCVVLKAVDDGAIVGSVRAQAKDGTCRIGRLIVRPDRQDRGVGKKLLAEIEDRFARQGIRDFELFTGEKSVKNLRLYRHAGYAERKRDRMSDRVEIVFLGKRIEP